MPRFLGERLILRNTPATNLDAKELNLRVILEIGSIKGHKGLTGVALTIPARMSKKVYNDDLSTAFARRVCCRERSFN